MWKCCPIFSCSDTPSKLRHFFIGLWMVKSLLTKPTKTPKDLMQISRFQANYALSGTFGPRPAIPHAFRVRLQQLPSVMRDTRLRLLPYFQDISALIAPTLYMLSLSKNCPNLNFHCPICHSHSIALLPGWQV